MQSVVALRGLAVGGAFCVLVATVAVTGVRLERTVPPADTANRLVYLPDANQLRPLVLGFNNVLADLLWFRTIDYFGAHYQSDRHYPWLARMCDLVTDLDPRAEHVYRFGGLILPWAASDPEAGIRILTKGVRNLPRSWLLRYHLGMTYYFFKQDMGQAADHLAQAALLPDAPPLVARLAALMGARRHGAATTLEFLREMRERTGSPEVREMLGRSITEAEAAVTIERLDGVVAAYRERTGRLPATLDDLVGAGLLRAVPPDVFGGRYELDPTTGRVRSSTGRVPLEMHRTPLQQRGLRFGDETASGGR